MDDIKDHIDFKAWEKIQNTFTDIVKLPVCTIDLDGNEILLTGELPYFSQILKTTKYGSKIIHESRKDAVKKLLDEKDKVILDYSSDGLLNIWSLIRAEGKNIGAIGCISLLHTNNKNIDFSGIVNNTNLDNDELNDALNKIKPLKTEEIRMYASMLHVLSKVVPELVKQKYESDKKISELTAIYDVTKIINSTLNLDKILNYIVNFIVDTLKVKNCSITILEEDSYFYKEVDNIKKLDYVVIQDTVNSKNIVKIDDIKTDFRLKNLELNFNFNSVLSLPLKIRGNVIGVLNLYFDKDQVSDFKFISIIADQVAMAIFNAKKFEVVKETAMIDKLTGLYNRRYFGDVLEKEIIKADPKNPFSVSMLDIDDFKQYNDTHGHVKGDVLIKDVGNILKDGVGSGNIVGRYGGEEFIILFPGLSNDEAFSILEDIRKKIENKEFYGSEKQPYGKVTISSGLVTCQDNSIKYEDLIEIVDKTLYKSKVNGKNLITNVVLVNKDLPPVDVGEVNKFSH